MPKSKTTLSAIILVVIILLGLSIFAIITYPQVLVNSPIALTLGTDSKNVEFEQPFLNDKLQVQVKIDSGVSLWEAKILDNDTVVWEHSTGQSEKTTFRSDWISLPSGSYNFTFKTIGIGSLGAVVTVSSKGSFW